MAATFLLPLATFASPNFDHRHINWTEILRTYVRDSGSTSAFDYRAAKAARVNMSHYTAGLRAVDRANYATWTVPQQLAFLINAYNAFTVELIMDHYPVRSIKDIGPMWSTPWKSQYFRLLGQDISLDRLEHEWIRPVFKDPRVHFALVCASKGCPKLRADAYVPDLLFAQLDEAATTFVNDDARNHYDAATRTLTLSPIFKWYADDFGGKAKVAHFVDTFRRDLAAAPLSVVQIQYGDYDWTLNDIR